MTILEAIRCGLAIRRLHRAGMKPMVRESRCGEGWVVYAGSRVEPWYAPRLIDALGSAEAATT